MLDLALYVLLVVALGIGFLLGRRERRKRRVETDALLPLHYFQGLNHLINERPDLAIDTFIDRMDVSDDTLDTHLALGVLVRRRGEIDRAIRVHQNLLARPVLSGDNRERVELELARDYLAAGLLGRAENLLLEIADKSRALKAVAFGHLLEIYQQESEWHKAIDVGKKLARADTTVRAQIAQFHCELAERALASGNLRETRRLLAQARQWDPGAPRVGLISARVELEGGSVREARKHLTRVADASPAFVPETLPLYRQSCINGRDDTDYERYLRRCLERDPSVAVVAELAGVVERTSGVDEARQLVSDQFLANPSQRGFLELLKRLDANAIDRLDDQLEALSRFTERLLESATPYRCDNCGFQGRTLAWHCPSCRRWGTVRRRRDDEGLSA